MGQTCSLSLLLFDIVTWVLRAIRQKNETKGTKTGKEEVKLFLLIDCMNKTLKTPPEDS
jgi:hypothetical protein